MAGLIATAAWRSAVANQPEHPMKVRVGLFVHDDHPAAGLHDCRDHPPRLVHHHVGLERHRDVRPDRGDHVGTEGEIGDEPAVHHVELDAVDPSFLERHALVTRAGKGRPAAPRGRSRSVDRWRGTAHPCRRRYPWHASPSGTGHACAGGSFPSRMGLGCEEWSDPYGNRGLPRRQRRRGGDRHQPLRPASAGRGVPAPRRRGVRVGPAVAGRTDPCRRDRAGGVPAPLEPAGGVRSGPWQPAFVPARAVPRAGRRSVALRVVAARAGREGRSSHRESRLRRRTRGASIWLWPSVCEVRWTGYN